MVLDVPTYMRTKSDVATTSHAEWVLVVVILAQVILLVLAISAQVKSSVLVIFVQVNLFVLIMSVKVDLSVEVRFFKVSQLVIVIFIINLFVRTIFASSIHQFQLNRYHLFFTSPFSIFSIL